MRKLSKPFIRKEQGSWGQKDGAGGGRESQQLESLGSDTAEQVEGSLQGRLEVSLAFPVLWSSRLACLGLEGMGPAGQGKR